MGKEKFPWLDDDETAIEAMRLEEKIGDKTGEDMRKNIEGQKNWKQKAKENWPLILFALLLVAFFLSRQESNETKKVTRKKEIRTVAILTAAFPLMKGDKILPTQLRTLVFDWKDLSKTQKQNRLREDDLNRFEGMIIAKKNIGPHRPLLWSDLEYRKPPHQQKKFPIIYGDQL